MIVFVFRLWRRQSLYMRKFKISTAVSVIYSWSLTEIKMVRFIVHKEKKDMVTSLSPTLWSSSAPTTPIYDIPVNMHPRRTSLYRGWLLLTAWRERRQSLVPLCWFFYDLYALYGPHDTCKSVFLSSCRSRHDSESWLKIVCLSLTSLIFLKSRISHFYSYYNIEWYQYNVKRYQEKREKEK